METDSIDGEFVGRPVPRLICLVEKPALMSAVLRETPLASRRGAHRAITGFSRRSLGPMVICWGDHDSSRNLLLWARAIQEAAHIHNEMLRVRGGEKKKKRVAANTTTPTKSPKVDARLTQ